jgi:[glutamine synthetase] adenylyltransferase / [glutamine synthetase]-adenylyl-L-tyrosine phosphorylase
LIEAIVRRSCYIALLLENPGSLDHLMRLARISPWIVTFLCKHPLLLDELLDMRSLYVPLDRKALAEELSNRLELVPKTILSFKWMTCVFSSRSTRFAS